MYGKMNETEKENNELEYYNFEVIYAKNTKQFIVFYNVGYYQPQNQVPHKCEEIECKVWKFLGLASCWLKRLIHSQILRFQYRETW